MNFERPEWLIAALILCAIFAWLYIRAEQRKTANDLAYSNLQFFASAAKPRRWIPAALRGAIIGALLLAAVGIAGPQLVLPVPSRDGTVFICVDTSGSMQSTDVQPTRAEAAKAAARAFINETPQGTKIGLISFSGSASLIQPLSADKDTVRNALDQIPSPNGATAIGDALRLAAQQFPPAGHRVVVLITDGVNNTGEDPGQIASYLGTRHIPVYTIGIGTPNGDFIAGTGEQASIDEDALRGYASASGGAYARVESAEQLRNALSRLGRLTSFERRRVSAEPEFLAAGFAVLLIATLTGLALGRYP